MPDSQEPNTDTLANNLAERMRRDILARALLRQHLQQILR